MPQGLNGSRETYQRPRRFTKVLAQNWHKTVGSVPDENRNNEVASRRDGGIIAAVFEVKKKIPE
jgi:hypothetical protein